MPVPFARAVSLSIAHQVHDCIDFIVTVQDVHQELVQMSRVCYWKVFGVTNPLSKVAEHIWFGE